MVCVVEVFESTPFCAPLVISGVIKDVLVWQTGSCSQLPMPYVVGDPVLLLG